MARRSALRTGRSEGCCTCARQALPKRIKKLRAGGNAALRELQHAEDLQTEAEADTRAELQAEVGT